MIQGAIAGNQQQGYVQSIKIQAERSGGKRQRVGAMRHNDAVIRFIHFSLDGLNERLPSGRRQIFTEQLQRPYAFELDIMMMTIMLLKQLNQLKSRRFGRVNRSCRSCRADCTAREYKQYIFHSMMLSVSYQFCNDSVSRVIPSRARNL